MSAETHSEMCWIITNSNDGERIADAVLTLLGITPSLNRSQVEHVKSEMNWILTNSNNGGRRSAASQVLVALHNIRG